jgi:hypothetical protein
MVYLTIDGEVIETTPWHPFYTDEGWTDAGDLEPGDLILALDGDYGTVESVVIADETQTMYDLDVETVDTFAVGGGAWVVHNCDVDLSGFKDFNAQYRNDISLHSNDRGMNSMDLDMLILTRYLREQAGQLDGYTGFTGRISTYGGARTSSGSTIFTIQNSGPRTGGLISAFGLDEINDLSKVVTVLDYGDIEVVNPLLIPNNQMPRWVKEVNGQFKDATANNHAEGNLIGFAGTNNITSIAISHPTGMCSRCENMMSQRFPNIPVYYSNWKRQ